ncbi:maleylpyruvate isomerase family mycothiol-dependent enzyme [Streptomyces sp. NPDC058657]|uniref:maleylpyruvate isomerase family mycothiol-dependent enzyme n=1 Tax=unclassified Streptomyces TaxID=2593676 RepID=UPI003665D9D4
MTTHTELPSRGERDATLPERLLHSELKPFLGLLRSRATDEDFAIRTCCPGWTVRHVVAHCSAALNRVLEERYEKGVFSPESNDRDIAERAEWPLSRLLDELEQGYERAGAVMGSWDGRLDGIALGEWVHTGDVREAWGVAEAYGGAGARHAVELLAHLSHKRKLPALRAELTDLGETYLLGADDTPASYAGDLPTLIRLYATRPLTGTRYHLTGLPEKSLTFFD